MREVPINEFGVGSTGTELVILVPPKGSISPERAMALAAWLVALAGGDRDEFEALLDAVEST
jgi:hypothetical protein